MGIIFDSSSKVPPPHVRNCAQAVRPRLGPPEGPEQRRMARFAGCSKWAAIVLAASGFLISPRAAQAQQHTFHLDRLEVPGAPDDGLVLFRPVTRPGAIFYAQLGLGLSIDPLRMSNIGIDSASNTARQVPTHVITSQFSTYIS